MVDRSSHAVDRVKDFVSRGMGVEGGGRQSIGWFDRLAAIYSLADGDAQKACPDQLRPPAAWIPRVQGSCWLSKV
jgi:hypothetical protein